MTVELYTCEGYPLATRPISYISKLSDWCLEEYPDTPILYAVPRLKCYTDKCTQYMTAAPLCDGTDSISIRNKECDFKRTIRTNCSQATYFHLIKAIQDITEIPGHLIQLYNADGPVNSKKDNYKLNTLKIVDRSELNLQLNNHFWILGKDKNFSLQECKPTWHQEQSTFGISLFFCCLYSLADWMAEPDQRLAGKPVQTLGHIRNVTKCPPLIHALNLLFRNATLTLAHRVAIEECLVLLFKVLLQNNKFKDLGIIEKKETENSNYFWVYLIDYSSREHMRTENYITFDLTCSETLRHMANPVLIEVNGVEHVVDSSALDAEVSCDQSLVTNYRRMLKSFIGDEAIVWDPTLEIIEVKVESTSLVDKCLDYPILCLQDALNVNYSHCPRPSIILPLNMQVGVYLGNSNNCEKHHVYFDVQTGSSVLFNAQARYISPYHLMYKSLVKIEDENNSNLIKPQEIIMVILDTSRSMRSPYLNGKSKFNSVKEAYGALLDRTIAYNLKHIIGLTLFAKNCRLHFQLRLHLQQSFEKFTSYSSILSRGKNIAIYKAIRFAVNQLNIYRRKNPEYNELPRRILCLSDGGGKNNLNEATAVTRLLIRNNIKMDCVLLCKKVVDTHIIAKVSGGYSFMPTDSEQMLSIFEQETMLSMKIRRHCMPTFAPGEFINLTSHNILPIDIMPDHILPENINIKVQTVKKCLTRAFIQKQLANHPDTDLTKSKRILQELSYYQEHPHPAIEVFPGEEYIDFWRIIMEGPEDTPYEGGIFELFIEFINEYPSKPPNIRFITPIYHCNINSSGRICHTILDRFYAPGVRVGEILIQIYELLRDPQPDNHLDSMKANLLCKDKIQYIQEAKTHTKICAVFKNRNNLTNDLLGPAHNAHVDYPAHLICPLTMELFKEPVITLDEKTYEKEAIENHIKCGKKYDPLTFDHLDEDQLSPNNVIKQLLAEL